MVNSIALQRARTGLWRIAPPLLAAMIAGLILVAVDLKQNNEPAREAIYIAYFWTMAALIGILSFVQRGSRLSGAVFTAAFTLSSIGILLQASIHAKISPLYLAYRHSLHLLVAVAISAALFELTTQKKSKIVTFSQEHFEHTWALAALVVIGSALVLKLPLWDLNKAALLLLLAAVLTRLHEQSIGAAKPKSSKARLQLGALLLFTAAIPFLLQRDTGPFTISLITIAALLFAAGDC